jgi:2-polyprenyl-3-methyl-5-hydroxy-6-metoxy-1,4-benzoquinol methylase
MAPQNAPVKHDWDRHWNRFGRAVRDNPATLYRRHLIWDGMRRQSAGARILDIGSGQGELAIWLAQEFPGTEIRGVEYSAAGVDRSREAATEARIGMRLSFSQRDLLEPQVMEDSERHWATVAICSEVLEHVDFPEVLLANAREYLDPECCLIVTVPSGPRTSFDRHIGHRRHFTKRSLSEVLEKSGFEVLVLRRAGFPFFNLYKLVVLLRGRALIADLDRDSPAPYSRLSDAVQRVFGIAFKWNLDSSPFGWQLYASATPKTMR